MVPEILRYPVVVGCCGRLPGLGWGITASISAIFPQEQLLHHHPASSFHPVPHFVFSVGAAQTGKYNQGKIGGGERKGGRGRQHPEGGGEGEERGGTSVAPPCLFLSGILLFPPQA